MRQEALWSENGEFCLVLLQLAYFASFRTSYEPGTVECLDLWKLNILGSVYYEVCILIEIYVELVLHASIQVNQEIFFFVYNFILIL